MDELWMHFLDQRVILTSRGLMVSNLHAGTSKQKGRGDIFHWNKPHAPTKTSLTPPKWQLCGHGHR